MSATVRFELKMDADEKSVVSRAAALMGTTMAGFVRAAAKEKAQALLERESRVTLSKRDFAAFARALDGAFTPNQALKGARQRRLTVLTRPTNRGRASPACGPAARHGDSARAVSSLQAAHRP